MEMNSGKSNLVCLCVFVLLILPSAGSATPPATGTAAECGGDFQKVMICLDFARGKAASPTKECCDAVEGIRSTEPKCLCYIMQQAHSGGGETLKSLGVQEAKLIQLPSACNLKNASIANCPKLLGLSPTSPDAAIFTGNNATSATPTAPGNSSPSTSSDPKGASIASTKDANLLFGLAAFVAIAVILASP